MSTVIKIVAACAVLCTILFTESQANAEASYDMTDLSLENSYTFTTNVNLYSVWLTNTSLHVNSTDKNMKPCNIAIDPTKDFTRNRIQAKALTSGQRFVIWGIRRDTHWLVEIDQGGHDTEYTVLLVDPWSCSYKSVPVPIYKRDWKDESNEILVVTNPDSFDVFLPSLKNCSPCRFDVEGNRVELQHQLEFSSPNLAPFVMPRGLHIEPIHPIDRKHGYFFARNFENNTSVMEHLDGDFKTLKQVYVDHPVHSVSVWPGKDLLLSICYTTQNHYSEAFSKNLEVHCQQLDSNLQPKLSIRLPAPMPKSPKNQFVYGMLHLTHQIDPLGNIYVGLMETGAKVNEETYQYEPRYLRYLAYDITGKLLKSYYVDEAEFHSITKISKFNYYKDFLHSHLLVGDKFCLVNNEFVSKNQETIHEVIRCFDIHEYYTKSPNQIS